MEKDNKLSPQFWNNKWQNQTTQWDIGYASPPLVRYLNQIEDKSLRILIPGAGSAYEAIYLHEQGFKNVFVCDWAEHSFTHLKSICPDFPKDHLIVGNFFKLELEVDLMIEQTFFCAIEPEQRTSYVKQAAQLIRPGGKLAGLLFALEFPFDGPPFGGTKEEYVGLFGKHFDILEMDAELSSIEARAGNELFFELQKPTS